MQRAALALLLATQVAAFPFKRRALQQGCTSAQSCSTLNTAYGGWSTDGGSALVCGESQSGTQCPKETFAKAQQICLSVGARLCTLDELKNGETQAKGSCNSGGAWSSTKGGCKGGKFMSTGTPSIDTVGQLTASSTKPACSSPNTQLHVRCCADIQVGVTCEGSADPCVVDHDNNGQVDMLETVQEACCPDYSCQMNMVTGVPLTCDRDCASEFLPFYRACHDKVQFGTDKSAFSGFDDTCRAAWVASGAAKNTQLSGCNMAELKKTCPTQELMLGIKYTSVDALCSSDCATKVSGQFDSCEANPATYQPVQTYSSLHEQCSTFQCINTADTMGSAIKQLCCSSGDDCAEADSCDYDCANSLIPWYDQCSETLSQQNTTLKNMYSKCTKLQKIPSNCPQQKSDAFFKVRSATQLLALEANTYIQTVATWDAAINHSASRQQLANVNKSAAINASNAAQLAVSHAVTAYNAAVNSYQAARVSCAQPGNMNEADCKDGSKEKTLKDIMSTKNETVIEQKALNVIASKKVVEATQRVTDANNDKSVQQRTQHMEINHAQLQQSKLRAKKTEAYNTLTKVLKTCTPAVAPNSTKPSGH